MNDMLVSVAVGLLCIAAVGMSATTLESSVSTEPDDIIDYEQFPISREDAVELKKQVKSDGTNPNQGTHQKKKQKRAKNPEKSGDQQAHKEKEVQKQQQKQRQKTTQVQKQAGQRTAPKEESLLDRLVDLLQKWGPILLVVALLAGLVYRYRERLLALAAALVPRGEDDDDDSGPDRPWADVDPRDEISRAWLALARRTDVERPRAKTTAEYADAAVEQGMDPDAVETVTREFEEVQYRGAEVTDERERRVSEYREELDGEEYRERLDEERRRTRGGRRGEHAGGDD